MAEKKKSEAAAVNDNPPADPNDLVFVVSNRRSGLRNDDAMKRSRESFDYSFAHVLSTDVNILQDIAPPDEDARRVLVVRGDPTDVARKLAELHPDVLVELLQPRYPLWYKSLAVRALDAAVGPRPIQPGHGTQILLHLKAGDGPAKGARMTVYLSAKTQPQKLTITVGTASAAGDATAEFDPAVWSPVAAHIEPAADAWDVLVKPVADGQAVTLPSLEKNGPTGWWAYLTGASSYSVDSGKGIRIGVVDTGVGPHPYLAHVQRIGSFTDGKGDPNPDSSNDVDRHGTHVCGIIGARPSSDQDYGGLAAGADVFVARVFPGGEKGAGQGDIAMAIEAFAGQSQVDVINLSLGGGPSAIEADAIQVALERGTLCLAATGNDSGAPVLYPAALANVVAISALGIPGVIPAQAIEALSQPPQGDKWSRLGIYLASFSNVGPQVFAVAPGDGIVSTVPASADFANPYVPMSGTSMACPVATATLAAMLAKNAAYQAMKRDSQRALRARQILQSSLLNLGLPAIYQGGGLVRQA